MGTSIRDKARRARSPKTPTVESQPPAKAESKPPTPAPEATPVPKAPESKALAAKDTPAPTDREQVASVTAINDHVVDRMTEDEVERFLAKAASGAGVAGLVATRETKTGQIQYDGKTEDGFVVRVWAPEGAPMLTRASLSG